VAYFAAERLKAKPLKVADMSLGRHVQLTLRTFNLVTDQARIFMSALS